MGPTPQPPCTGTYYIAMRSLVLEGSSTSIQEAWAIEGSDGAALVDIGKELTE